MESTANAPASARRLPRAIGMMRAFSKPRVHQGTVVISSPIGPVKSSRGADLVRSDTLTIVAGIDSKTNTDDTNPSNQSIVSVTSRLLAPEEVSIEALRSVQSLSSGLGDGASFVGKPALPSSNTTATTALQSRSHNHTSPSRKPLVKPSTSVPLIKLTQSPRSAPLSTTIVTPLVQDENIPPPNDDTPESKSEVQAHNFKSKISKLPRSRTMGVLSELKASIQRPVISRARKESHITTPRLESSPSTDSTKTAVPNSNTSSRVWLPYSSLTSLVRSSRSCTPEPVRPDQVVAAQPSEYWSGRFMALHDRFLSEAQEEKPIPPPSKTAGTPSKSPATSLRARAGQRRASKGDTLNSSSSQLPFSTKSTLPHANTTSSLSKIIFKPSSGNTPDADDERCRRIFTRLEESCLNIEAKQSLQDWQHVYARRTNRPSLLPVGRVMDEKSRVARFFSGSSMGKRRQSQRQSLPGVSNVGKKAKLVDVSRKKSLVVL